MPSSHSKKQIGLIRIDKRRVEAAFSKISMSFDCRLIGCLGQSG